MAQDQHLFSPFITDYTFNINLQNMEMSAQFSKGDVRARWFEIKTIDGNDIGLDLIISYRVIPEIAPYILENVAENDKELRTKLFGLLLEVSQEIILDN